MKSSHSRFYTIDWKAVSKKVCGELGRAYTSTYCRLVWEGKYVSGKLLNELKKILGEVK